MSLFPECGLDELEVSIKGYLPEFSVVRRGLVPQDGPQVIGLRAGEWTPIVSTHEIGSDEPTVNVYHYEAELLIKTPDEPMGRQLYTEGAKKLRAVLYRDSDLRLRLAELRDDFMGSTERFQKLNVVGQQFLKNDIRGDWFFIATTRFTIETEVSPTP